LERAIVLKVVVCGSLVVGTRFLEHLVEESHDDVGIGDVGKLGALVGEMLDIVMEGLARLLFIAPEVPRVTRAYVGPFEVPFEHPFQVILVVDLSR
jgi:hypothetical protein